MSVIWTFDFLTSFQRRISWSWELVRVHRHLLRTRLEAAQISAPEDHGGDDGGGDDGGGDDGGGDDGGGDGGYSDNNNSDLAENL